ncbi:MAG: thiol-disulfide isomerase/thioredoxin [Cyclobacteriaceae bacterium]|jgi:thiol-disulfide isomerase/thioredoxin
MKLFTLVLSLLIYSAAYSQQIQVIKLDQLQQVIDIKTDKVKVINFWASWCGPCVQELPYFDALVKNAQLEVSLVSVDFIQDIEKANTLLRKKGIKSSSYLLDEKSFVAEIESSWSGAIPATLILDTNGTRYFYEQAFTELELQELVNSIISK